MDKEQFIRQIESIQRAVRRFLTALCCGNASLADDLAQDTFVKAYLSLDNYNGRGNFTSYIFRIAHNTFISHTRSVVKHEEISEALAVKDNNESDNAFKYQDLYEALKRLSAIERSAVTLHYLQGYPINDVAEITESSVDAVKQRLMRARQHLKDLLKE